MDMRASLCRTVFFVALLLLSVIARAQVPPRDSRCDRRPYGATPEEFAAAQSSLHDIAEAIASDMAAKDGRPLGSFMHGTDWYLKNMVFMGLRKACYAKFDVSTPAQEDFRNAGVDDEQLHSLSTMTIAIRYFHGIGYPSNPQTDVHCNLSASRDHPVWASYEECKRLVDAEQQQRDDEAARQRQLQAQYASEAHNAGCDGPPYGDTPQRYKALHSTSLRAASAQSGAAQQLHGSVVEDAMKRACEAKFGHGDRLRFYSAGIDDDQIDRSSTMELTRAWILARNQAIAKEQEEEKEDPSRVYALFQCLQQTGQCRMQGAAHFSLGNYFPDQLFPTLAKCKDYMRRSQMPPSPTTGRYVLANSMWYECLSKHVDNWTPAH